MLILDLPSHYADLAAAYERAGRRKQNGDLLFDFAHCTLFPFLLTIFDEMHPPLHFLPSYLEIEHIPLLS